jgi:hypothetical protein
MGVKVLQPLSTADEQQAKSVSLTDFKDIYAQYCFLVDHTEMNLHSDKAKKLFIQKGVKLEPVPTNEQPYAFTRLRWKTQREKEKVDAAPGGSSRSPLETSLEYFLRVECQRTSFDTEQITIDTFKSQYGLFCEKHRLMDQVSVSKAGMQEKGVNHIRAKTYRLVPNQDEEIEKSMMDNMTEMMQMDNMKTPMVVNLKVANKVLEEIMKFKRPNVGGALDGHWFWSYWWLFDGIAVILHFLMSLTLFLPLQIPALWLATVYGEFSPKEAKDTLMLSDFSSQPARFLFKSWLSFPVFVVITLLPGIVTIQVCFFDLVVYYSRQEWPANPLQPFIQALEKEGKKETKRGFARARDAYRTLKATPIEGFMICLHTLMWFIVGLFIFAFVGLVVHVTIWCILGALINPNSFLAYATGALTGVAFVTGKYAEFKAVFFKSLDEIVNGLDKVMGDALNSTLRTIMNSSVLDKLSDQLPGGIKQMAEKHVDMLSGSSLGKNVMSAGFELDDVVKLASGDKEAFNSFALKNGIPVEIIAIAIGVVEKKNEDVLQAIGDLLRKYAKDSPVGPDLAVALAEVALDTSKPKVQKCIDAIYMEAIPVVLKIYMEKTGTDPSKLQAAASAASDLLPEIKVSQQALAKAQEWKEELPDHVKTLIPEVVQTAAKSYVQEAMDNGASYTSLQAAATRKSEEALRTVYKKVEAMSDAQLGAWALTPVLRDTFIKKVAEMQQDPTARTCLKALIQAEAAVEFALKKADPSLATGVAENAAQKVSSLDKDTFQQYSRLLVGILPPLMRGIVAMQQKDFQTFVSSLRFVHSQLIAKSSYSVQS